MTATSRRKLSSADMQPLEDLKAQFEQWRISLNGRKARLPETLWEATKQLTTRYKYSRIAEALKLSGRRRYALRAYCDTSAAGIDKSPRVTPIADFVQVSVPLATSATAPDSAAITIGTIELLRTDGTSLKASGLSAQNLYAIVTRFLES